jgi:hypothetical protein
LLGRACAGCTIGYDHIDVELDQLGCEFGKAVVSAVGPAIVDDNVLALVVSELAKAVRMASTCRLCSTCEVVPRKPML